jgi:hypothetical protein
MPTTTYSVLVAQIEVSRGKYVALVDEEDVAKLSMHRWYATVVRRKRADGSEWTNVYAHTRIRIQVGVWRSMPMHRMILSPEPRLVVDHVNWNGLDNRRENLRAVSRSVDAKNRRAVGVEFVVQPQGRMPARSLVNRGGTIEAAALVLQDHPLCVAEIVRRIRLTGKEVKFKTIERNLARKAAAGQVFVKVRPGVYGPMAGQGRW